MAGPKQAETFVTGVIASLNDKGLKLEGADSWVNFSKYAKGLPELERGDHVTLRLQGDFIMGAKIGGQPDNGPRRSSRQDDGERDFEDAMERQGQPGRAKPERSDRDALIVRQVALKAAVDYYQGKDLPTCDDVLAVAETFYEWVLRGE